MSDIPRPSTFPWLSDLPSKVPQQRILKTLQGTVYVEIMGVFVRVPVPGDIVLPEDHNSQVEVVTRILEYMAGMRQQQPW